MTRKHLFLPGVGALSALVGASVVLLATGSRHVAWVVQHSEQVSKLLSSLAALCSPWAWPVVAGLLGWAVAPEIVTLLRTAAKRALEIPTPFGTLKVGAAELEKVSERLEQGIAELGTSRALLNRASELLAQRSKEGSVPPSEIMDTNWEGWVALADAENALRRADEQQRGAKSGLTSLQQMLGQLAEEMAVKAAARAQRDSKWTP